MSPFNITSPLMPLCFSSCFFSSSPFPDHSHHGHQEHHCNLCIKRCAGSVPKYHTFSRIVWDPKDQTTDTLTFLHRHTPPNRYTSTLARSLPQCPPRRPRRQISRGISIWIPQPSVLCLQRCIFPFNRRKHCFYNSQPKRPVSRLFEPCLPDQYRILSCETCRSSEDSRNLFRDSTLILEETF